MRIEFSVQDDHRAVVIEVKGRVSVEDVQRVRRRSVELAEQTGHNNFIVDLRGLVSIDDGSTVTAYELGDQFKSSGLSVWTNTAVLMPEDPAARKQAEFMHAVEVNRGRGLLSYVESYDEAYDWFDTMARLG
jgi:hypothetical protein